MKDMVVIDTKIPDPDSQWRLRGCRCGWDRPVYQQLDCGNRRPWVVRCQACGATGPQTQIRHDAQIYWNTNLAAAPIIRRAI